MYVESGKLSKPHRSQLCRLHDGSNTKCLHQVTVCRYSMRTLSVVINQSITQVFACKQWHKSEFGPNGNDRMLFRTEGSTFYLASYTRRISPIIALIYLVNSEIAI